MDHDFATAPSTKEGFRTFVRGRPATLLLREQDVDGYLCSYYTMDGLPDGLVRAGNLHAILTPWNVQFVVAIAGKAMFHWWIYDHEDLGLHPADFALLLSVQVDALDLLHLPRLSDTTLPNVGDLFQA